jgi:CheY-like chemotaxis protein
LVDVKKRYVLVVEDNRMISLILDESLKKLGLVAIIAENGKIGVEKFTEFMHKG